MAKGYYDQWFGLAVSSRMGFQFFYQAKQYPDAAYNLQQACERLYYCILLVFTFYTPYSRSEEHTSELQSLMRISYAVFCLKKKTDNKKILLHKHTIVNSPIIH